MSYAQRRWSASAAAWGRLPWDGTARRARGAGACLSAPGFWVPLLLLPHASARPGSRCAFPGFLVARPPGSVLRTDTTIQSAASASFDRSTNLESLTRSSQPFSPDIAQDNGRTWRMWPTPFGVPIRLRPSALSGGREDLADRPPPPPGGDEEVSPFGARTPSVCFSAEEGWWSTPTKPARWGRFFWALGPDANAAPRGHHNHRHPYGNAISRPS